MFKMNFKTYLVTEMGRNEPKQCINTLGKLKSCQTQRSDTEADNSRHSVTSIKIATAQCNGQFHKVP